MYNIINIRVPDITAHAQAVATWPFLQFSNRPGNKTKTDIAPMLPNFQWNANSLCECAWEFLDKDILQQLHHFFLTNLHLQCAYNAFRTTQQM